MKTKFYFLLSAVIGLVALPACSDDDDDKIENSIPSNFTETLNQAFPNVKNAKWELNPPYRVAEFSENNGQIETEVWFNTDAKIVMTNKDYGKNLFYIPAVVNAAFEKTEYGSAPWVVDDIDYYERTNDMFYVIEVDAPNQHDVSLFYDVNGNSIKTVKGDIPDITPDTKL